MAIKKIRAVCASFPFTVVLFALATLITLFRWEVPGTVVFVLILSALLAVCEDITVTLLPFLLLSMFVCKCYDSFHTFIRLWPVAVLPVAALIFHFVFYRRKITVGRTFLPLCGVAVAITLGGAFSISFGEYFSGTSLFYVFALGIGMVGTYLLMKSSFVRRTEYNIKLRFSAIMIAVGFFGAVMVASHYMSCIPGLLAGEMPAPPQWSNNISTFLMLALPFPFCFAYLRHHGWLAAGLLFYLSLLLSGSRGGILMGTAELVLCLLIFSLRDKKIGIFTLLLISISGFLVVLFLPQVIKLYHAFFSHAGSEGIIAPGEARVKLIRCAIHDFLSAPVFGRGFGYTGNSAIYNPKLGGANWYHMYLCQVIGSFGSVGVLAFGWQLIARFRLLLSRRSTLNVTIFLSYIGLFLMSQVNPGEFCPLPYGLLAVLCFILIELPPPTTAKNMPRNAFEAWPFSVRKRIYAGMIVVDEDEDEEI